MSSTTPEPDPYKAERKMRQFAQNIVTRSGRRAAERTIRDQRTKKP